jgi:hypothetical protein
MVGTIEHEGITLTAHLYQGIEIVLMHGDKVAGLYCAESGLRIPGLGMPDAPDGLAVESVFDEREGEYIILKVGVRG